jgi:membrane protein required for colicin V production
MGTLSAADLVLGGACLFFVIRGFWVGFTGELFSLIGGIAGFFAAIKGGPSTAAFILEQPWAPSLSLKLLSVLCGFLLFVLCVVLSSMIGRGVGKGLKRVRLGGLDRVMGAVTGLAKAALLLFLLYAVVYSLFPGDPPTWFQKSKIMTAIEALWPLALSSLSKWGFEIPGLLSGGPGGVNP